MTKNWLEELDPVKYIQSYIKTILSQLASPPVATTVFALFVFCCWTFLSAKNKLHRIMLAGKSPAIALLIAKYIFYFILYISKGDGLRELFNKGHTLPINEAICVGIDLSITATSFLSNMNNLMEPKYKYSSFAILNTSLLSFAIYYAVTYPLLTDKSYSNMSTLMLNPANIIVAIYVVFIYLIYRAVQIYKNSNQRITKVVQKMTKFSFGNLLSLDEI